MELPGPESHLWSDVISGRRELRFEYLATRIYMGQARLKVKNDPGQAATCATKLRQLFADNARLPKVQRDLQKLLGN